VKLERNWKEGGSPSLRTREPDTEGRYESSLNLHPASDRGMEKNKVSGKQGRAVGKREITTSRRKSAYSTSCALRLRANGELGKVPSTNGRGMIPKKGSC